MQSFPVTVPPAPRPLPIYSIKRIALAINQGLALLEFFSHPILFSQSLINADIFYLYDKPWSPNVIWFWATQIYRNLIEETSMGPYVAKMFFLHSSHKKVSDPKMSKLTFCFSILLLRLVAELRGWEEAIYWRQKSPANNDQFTSYMN